MDDDNTIEKFQEQYDDVMDKLKSGENFSFNRINDGEMRGVRSVGPVVARGHQEISESLHQKLIEAVQFRKHNYYFGRVCSTCRRKNRAAFDRYVPDDYPHIVSSTLFCHNNMWEKFIDDFNKVAQNREIVWVSGPDQKLDKLEFEISNFIEVPCCDAWSKFEEVLPMVESFNPGCIVSLSCGPLARVLAYEWFKKRQDCTFFVMGSWYDPITRGVWSRAQYNAAPYCPECNLTGVKKEKADE